MNQIVRPELLPKRPGEEDDPFRIGYRYVRRELPDGTEEWDEVPLTEEDLLYPEEGDWIVQQEPHVRDFVYCLVNLRAFYNAKGDPSVVVLGDHRVDFGVRGLQPLVPDVLVLFDVREWLQTATYQLAVEGGRPVLALEITSPSTRRADVGPKVNLYHRAGISQYVIVDRGPTGEDPARIIGRHRTPTGWQSLDLDPQGRLNLAPVPLLLGIEDELTWLYDPVTGERLLDPVDNPLALREARAQAEEALRAREKAEASAKRAQTQARKATAARKKAGAKAKEDATALAEMEKRIRELEEQLRRQQGKP